MKRLLSKAQTIMTDAGEVVMREAAIISAAQKVEHYKIASYGTLRTFAQTIGLNDAVSILKSTLEEEKKPMRCLPSLRYPPSIRKHL